MTKPQNIDITAIITEAVRDKKGSAISIVDLSAIEFAPTRTFVICQARNPIQVAAVADQIIDSVLDQAGRKPEASDGYRNREWIIIDYGETMVHIFLPEVRERYALEDLYSDAPVTEMPDED